MRGKKLIMCIASVLVIGVAVACNARSEIGDSTVKKKAEEELSANKDVISQINIEENEGLIDTGNNSNHNNNNKDSDRGTKDVVEQIEETEVFGKVTEKPATDGNKTNKIGTYAEVTINDKSKFTDKNLIKFYKDTVEDSDYKWVTIRLSKNKGIQFIGSSFVFNYGTLDDNGTVTNILGSGNIMEDKIEYQKK